MQPMLLIQTALRILDIRSVCGPRVPIMKVELTDTKEKFNNTYPISLFPSVFLSQKLKDKAGVAIELYTTRQPTVLYADHSFYRFY